LIAERIACLAARRSWSLSRRGKLWVEVLGSPSARKLRRPPVEEPR
jgi:hypothetical protein